MLVQFHYSLRRIRRYQWNFSILQSMKFSKYHGAGNDFIIIDDRNGIAKNLDSTSIAQWCDRHFGIGADGLMLLREHQTYDFEMVYFNSDGQPSTMCGNGGRCLTSFAHRLGLVDKE